MPLVRAGKVEIDCFQVLEREARVRSEQWTVLPLADASVVTPEWLLVHYLRHVRRCTGTLVRSRRSASGIEFRFLGNTLLAFGPPQQDAGKLTLAITGGLLTQKKSSRKGELAFICEVCREGMRLAVHLTDYAPALLGSPLPGRLRKRFYGLTQAAIHQLVTVRFLWQLRQEQAGRQIGWRLVRMNGAGENI
jgi:hypothetical protein